MKERAFLDSDPLLPLRMALATLLDNSTWFVD